MTLKLAESFDWLETADLPGAYSAFSNIQPIATMTQTIQEGGGRNGDKCLRIIPGTDGSDATPYFIQGKGFSTGISGGGTLFMGVAVKFNTLHDTSNLQFIAIKSTAGTGNNLYNLFLALNSSYQLVAGYSASDGTWTVHGTATTVFTTGMWYYIELKFVSHSSSGIVVVRINGATEINLSGLNTLRTDNGVNSVVLGSTIPATITPSIDFDDLYIADDAGSLNNDFLGTIEVQQLKPNGNGNSSQFVGSDADSTDNYLLVDDDAAPDDDTTYVESSTSGNKDTYAFENLPAAVTAVKAVCVKVLAKKVDGGAANIKAVARSSGTESDSAELGIDTSYMAKQAIFEVDPNTSAAWGTSAVDSAEFGIKVA